MKRRAFLGSSVGAALSVITAPSIITCACDAFARDIPLAFGTITININDYPVLKNVGGSVHVPRFDSGYPLVVTRVEGSTFTAVSSDCTHAEGTVQPYNSSKGYMQCNLHFSRFDAYGNVTRGPAGTNLPRYQVTFDGVETITIIDTPASVKGEVISAFNIQNISPNPFSERTTIGLDLKQSTSIDLAIYDTDGTKLSSVFEGTLDRGKHSFIFDGSTLAAGSYFCRLTTEAGSIVRQIHIVR